MSEHSTARLRRWHHRVRNLLASLPVLFGLAAAGPSPAAAPDPSRATGIPAAPGAGAAVRSGPLAAGAPNTPGVPSKRTRGPNGLVAGDEGDGGGGSSTPTVPTFFEQGVPIRSGQVVQPLGPNLMGDRLNEHSGGLSFSHTDVSLPGNNKLMVAIGRQLNTGTRQAALGSGHFGDWDLEVPRLHTEAFSAQPNWYGGDGLGNYNLNRCSQLVEPPRATYYAGSRVTGLHPASWWSGFKMYVPGAGDQVLLRRANAWTPGSPVNLNAPTDGTAYPVLTKEHWQLSCLPTLARGAGEGFLALAPDGTRYRFDHMVSRAYPALDTVRYGRVPRLEIWILPTLVTDRFGNWVRYTWAGTDGMRLSSITSSDGRTITITYSGWGNRIQSVNDGNRTWAYGYDSTGALQTVTQPDGSQWRFALAALEKDPFSIEDPGCTTNPNARWDPNLHVGTITHPSGAVGSFSLKMTGHGRTNVPGSEEACWGPTPDLRANLVSRVFANYALVNKTLSGPGMPPMSWSYAYSEPFGCFDTDTICRGNGTKTVTATDPHGDVIAKTFGTRFGVNDGLLLSSTVSRGGAVVQSTQQTYQAPNSGPYPAQVGWYGGQSNSMGVIYTPLRQRTITQQGVTFTRTVDSFDRFARATAVTRSSSLGTSRSDTTTYQDQTALWVLGQVAARTVAGVQSERITFDPTTALPLASYKFGLLVARYTFHPDGNLASLTDPLNRSTGFSQYMRGLAQRITHADGNVMSGVVNNLGLIVSLTNEVGTTWTYGYDAMGRMASETPPGGDATPYHAKTFSFVQVPVPEYGLEAGHWRQTITQGSAVTVNYFDARWRKRLTVSFDATNPGGTQRMQLFHYDAYNRTLFASYPARAIDGIAASPPGSITAYDALGRPVQQLADSELGKLSTTTQYLAGFQKQVTNPRGGATTTAFQVFDQPTEDDPTVIAAPEGVSVRIHRDVFGKTTAITRSGGGASVTRNYVYDAYQRLCKTIEPETGVTVQDHDPAGNLAWKASGLALPSLAQCDHTSVPAARMLSFGYDVRNRLVSTNHGDGSPGIVRTYTADGLPWQVWAGNNVWTYGYNNRRALVAETMGFNGQEWRIGWGIDAYGRPTSVTYPDGATVHHALDALGQPTGASGIASGVTHHPNGLLAGYTLANGITHATSLNVRGMVAQLRDSGVTQDAYSYDANGNVTAITDQQLGVGSRSMGYDGLDRLTVANGIWGAGAYQYDAIDNLRASTVGGRSLSHNIDPATNRLSSLTGSQNLAIAYDANGNVTQRGSQAFSFDIANRMHSAAGKATYTYDGHGRRMLTTFADGSRRLQLYSKGGKLLYTQHSTQGGTRYVYLGNKLIAEAGQATGTVFVHTDGLGSPVARTTTSGAVESRTHYEPYGATAAGTNPTGVGFTGHVNDADTGLVYMQQRYNDPVAGRFLSVDPVTTNVKNGSSFNRYAYGNLNPYKFKDPDGRFAETLWDIASLALSVVEFRNNPSVGNAIGVAVDAAAVVIPGIPGGVGAIRAADKAADAAGAATRVEKTASGKRVGDFTRSQKAAAKAENAAAHGGQMRCTDCDKAVESIKSEKGVPTPDNQAQVHHDPAIQYGGGQHSTPVVLCSDCHKIRHATEH